MPIDTDPFESLIFIFANGCGACEAAMPELDKFMAANPRLMVTKIEANGPFVERLTGIRRVEATPMYVYRRGNEGVVKVGAMKVKDLDRWLRRIHDGSER